MVDGEQGEDVKQAGHPEPPPALHEARWLGQEGQWMGAKKGVYVKAAFGGEIA